MPWSVLHLPLALPVLALVMFRLGGLVLTAPLFSSRVMPIKVRMMLVVGLGALLMPVIAPQVPADVPLGVALVGGVGELLLGACIGLTLAMLLAGVELAGMLVGMQAGLAISRVVDPTQGRQTNVLAQSFNTIVLLVFLCIGGHRALVGALLDTYQTIPVLSYSAGEPVVVLLAEVMTCAFVLGIRLAAPGLIALFLVTTTLGFLTRTMPQMNILTVGFTVKALVAIGGAGLTLMLAGDLLVSSILDLMDLLRDQFVVPLS